MRLLRMGSRSALFVLCGGMLVAQTPTGTDAGPISQEINSQLPSWLHFGGEERARFEGITGEGFKPVGDAYMLNRLRLSMEVKPLDWLKFVLQSEDSRVFGQRTRPAPATQKD